ncbi:hypothetical protein [Xanthomonas phage Carpasina]|uniref:Uncharacterized protein n=1 Tax=Xanthomonas phage Carpasina TaxID=2163636 RepID=A0A2S1GST1_9CAUD|nr:hypothetical protein HOT16_gp60 [Xanthomonas phage Carpasina]AWD92455.1 hypothetical protein [Xanthomonas phage Carpasina]
MKVPDERSLLTQKFGMIATSTDAPAKRNPEMTNVLNYPFKLNYPSGKFQFISDKQAAALLEEDQLEALKALQPGQTFTDIDGDQWQRVAS